MHHHSFVYSKINPYKYKLYVYTYKSILKICHTLLILHVFLYLLFSTLYLIFGKRETFLDIFSCFSLYTLDIMILCYYFGRFLPYVIVNSHRRYFLSNIPFPFKRIFLHYMIIGFLFSVLFSLLR